MDPSIPLKAIPFLLSSLTYLFLGIAIFVKNKNRAQRLYGALCVAICLWQGIWVLAFSELPSQAMDLGIRIGYTGIVFIPSIFYNFVLEFASVKKDKAWLFLSYLTSSVLAILIWTGILCISGVHAFSWGLAAKAGRLHPIFLVLIITTVGRMAYLLLALIVKRELPKHRRHQAILVLAALGTNSLGILDLLSNYGISVFPISSLFTGVAFFLFTYAIFRYDFLSIAIPHHNEEDHSRRMSFTLEMTNLGMSVAFPLVSQGEVLGYLLLGEKMSEETYTKEDLLLLRIIANQAALAYQRVRYLEMAVHGARTEMLGEIAGGFAHEIKTPLANISLPAELSIMDLTDVEKGQKKFGDILPELKSRLKDIMQQTFKASEKIEAIRQFSKPGQVQLASVDLSSVLQNSLGLLDHMLRKMGAKVRLDFPVMMNPIRGDAKQLEIVFVNLIKNAAEAMSHNVSPGLAREIWLKGYEDGNWVVVSVKDAGPGIKKTEFSHLFEAYFTTKGSGGTGMGLFLSRQVIKAHGGSIDVKSEEGRGTEFLIRLPKHISENRSGVHEAA